MSVVGMPGFTETEIGWIPTDWSIQSVASLSNVDSESLSNKTAADFTFRYISLGDVDAAKLIGGHSLITFAEAPSRARRIVKSGDILFATVRPNLKGHFFARRVDGNVVASTGFAVIRAKAGVASPAFLYQSLLSGNVDAQIEKLTVGSNYPAVNSADVKGLLLPAPPLPEQQKIAAILTAVDDKLDVIARQIEATQTLKQGLMQTLFSRGVGTQDADGRWVPHAEFKDSELGEIPAGWTLMPLEELAVENITYGVVQPGESVEGGIPLVRGGDIKSGRIAANLRTVSTEISNQFKRTILKGGEVLVSLVGYPGETAVVPSQLAGANIARQAGMIRTGSVSTSEFIHYYLSSSVGKSFLLAGMIGSAQQVINLKALREVLIPLPSVAERERICSICSAVTKKLQALEDKQSSFQDLKRGLMQKLLTGEWRVSVDASETGA